LLGQARIATSNERGDCDHDQHQRKERQEGGEGDERGKLAATVVAVLLEHAHDESGNIRPLLPPVDVPNS
jgi:hypothetical protein